MRPFSRVILDALRREVQRVSDSFLQVNDDGIAFLLADAFSEIRFDGQLMGAVSQSHERAAEWMAVDGALTSRKRFDVYSQQSREAADAQAKFPAPQQ
jgi:hypothetical protein